MTPRHRHFLIAVLISVFFHVMAYAWWDSRHRRSYDQPAAGVTRLAVRVVSPAPATMPPPPPVAPIPPEPTAAPVPPVTPRKRPVAAPARKHPEPRPAPAPAAVSASADLTQAAVAQPAPAAVQTTDSEALRERYLRNLFAHIERHKYYPDSARRRGMEASVRVSFELTAAGGITGLAVAGGPKVLRLAATRTLRNAEPLPLPPTGIDLPLRVEYLMSFTLD